MEQKEAGLTITELVVTMAVFAILLPAIATMISSIESIGDRSRDMLAVHSLAENKVESLRSASFAGVSNGSTDFTDELPETVTKPRSAIYTVSEVNSSLKQVDVTISYTDRGTSRTLEYRTYLGELGVGQY